MPDSDSKHFFPGWFQKKFPALYECRIAFGTALLFCIAFLIFNLKNPLFYDDAFISMRIARNFIEGKGLYHNLEEKVQTNTSLLYPILTAPFQWLSPDLAPRAVMSFDFFLFFLNILLISGLLIKISDIGKLIASRQILLFSVLNFALYSGRVVTPGMETQLYLLFISGTFLLRQSGLFSFIPASLIVFCRPEGILLFWSIWLSGIRRRISVTEKIIPALFALLVTGFFLLIGYWVYGSAIPHTILVKQCLKPVYAESVIFLFRQVMFDMRYLFLAVLQAIGIWYAWQNLHRNIIREVAVFLLVYMVFFTFGPGWNRFFGWYQMPVKFLLTFLAVLQLSEWMKTGLRLVMPVFFLVLAVYEGNVYRRMATYRQDGIRSAGKMLAQLTENQSFAITCEPIGFLSYHAGSCRFRDYPGLASRISLRILREHGPVSVKSYFDNPAFLAIIRESGSGLVLLSRPEYASFKTIMNREFRFICRIGKYSEQEFNSEFLVFANPRNLDTEKIRKLENRAGRLGYPSALP